ncbi:MAG: hypothetical protein P1U42_08035 [Phycisphaerales bacterium]|nr:hypothetical protein [Phycisphaerales bacterium]
MDQSTQTNPSNAEPVAEPPRKSPWSMKAKIIRLGWGICELLFWKLSPTWAWGFRRFMLRMFGASVGQRVKIHPSVKVIIPWHIKIGDDVVVHERAILYALGDIEIGDQSEIGPLVHICAGTHDYTDPAFTLLRQPITIGKRCVLCAASFVAPNVTLSDGTILMPRAAIYSDTRSGACYNGNPAKIYALEPVENNQEENVA